MNSDSKIYKFLRCATITANILFFLWILYNGVNEGFQGTRVEVVSFIGLMILLVLNTFYLWRGKN